MKGANLPVQQELLSYLAGDCKLAVTIFSRGRICAEMYVAMASKVARTLHPLSAEVSKDY
jgi:hypothetical protein